MCPPIAVHGADDRSAGRGDLRGFCRRHRGISDVLAESSGTEAEDGRGPGSLRQQHPRHGKEAVPVYIAPDITGLEEATISSVVATADDGNAAENTIDGDLVSRWSAAGKQSITYTLENVTDVKGLGIAFYSGDQRSTYFDILVSEDGENWETVSICQSSGLTLEFEYFLFDTAKKAKYIRLDCRGNNSSASYKWNSITEVKAFK